VTGLLGPYFWYYKTARESQAHLGAHSFNNKQMLIEVTGPLGPNFW